MTRDDQKDDEMFVSEFFIERVNEFYGFDYIPKKNEKENEETRHIDVFARSKIEKHPEIKMQLTTCDANLHVSLAKMRKDWKDLDKDKKRYAPFAVCKKTGIKLIDPIRKSLNKKIRKEDEILILHNDFSLEMRPFERNFINDFLLPLVEEKTYLEKNPYRGIFLVITPTPSIRSITSFKHNGQVVALKNIFGRDGEVF